MMDWWLAGTIAAFSCVLTGIVRHYALARNLLDVPNARSSHVMPTPRGGGVAIVLGFVVATAWAYFQGEVGTWAIACFAGAGGIVAVVGFLDDHGHIAARWRLVAHFVASAIAMYALGGMPTLQLGSYALDPMWLRMAIGILFFVWMLNLYNFMDGIDGIAGVEAITVCASACLLYWLNGDEPLLTLPSLLAFAVLGFQVWNFPPAKIFMGDAGSGFLGFTLGVLAIQAAWTDPVYFWVWCILLGVFIVDATFTLLRRLLTGSKVYEAHRTHAYQYAARRAGSHWRVTLGVAVANVLWLLPIAVLVASGSLNGCVGVIVAYLPLVALAIFFEAGKRETPTVAATR
ncbi:glycosyltransferase family 4 protein [Pseudomonas sp. dw_358]|uniref:MraY family glycosyltransferase n=1 Tax=Pseudomonas sp. dw_358 TaxID=2720083 RepID=UPI001BD2FFD3|nr:glycosyltransferase family 4 protein [Pseudomonas sp. dw_358]